MKETVDASLSTGIPTLDGVLKGVNAGDNIVWEVEAVEDYADLVRPYAAAAVRHGHRTIYFRFASHPPLLAPGDGVELHEFQPEEGFEPFLDRIHDTIRRAGRGAHYVFDCLSELAADWYSDQMLGNFFVLTCPYLYDLETVTYFGLFSGRHSPHAVEPILHTTQLYLEVLRRGTSRYIRPVKVQHRYSATINMLHAWKDGEVRLVTSSAEIAEALATGRDPGLNVDRRPGPWHRTFLDVLSEKADIDAGRAPAEREAVLSDRLMRMMVSRDDRVLGLVRTHFALDDFLAIRERMVGTGRIGGKTVGMLLARAMLRTADPRLAELLETHDSFYVGSDVYCTYLVHNGVWWLREKQRDPETFLEGAEQARRRILTGTFPEFLVRQLERVLDYYGQSPFIVRSSSLLEDNFGNAFAGKYESVFCANQGSRERRMEDFLSAIRTVYASAMGERALRYRAERDLLELDEQMALLIMRVSGEMVGRSFFPPAAGVAFSYNPYVWNADIDPKAGVARLVFGLGTRAVNRSDDDYTRIVALNAPMLRPESNFDEVCQTAQRNMDYIDLDANRLVSGHVLDVVSPSTDLPMDLFITQDPSNEPGHPGARALTFERLLTHTDFVDDMRAILSTLQMGYGSPVDIEFTVNFDADERYRINLVQCRPLQVRGHEDGALPSIDVEPARRIIEARGAVVGHSRVTAIDRFIYVVPSVYGTLPMQDRHEIAQVLGRLNRAATRRPPGEIMILGPGRWGTSSPELGVPVAFSDISRASVLCEIVAMHKDLVPDVSLGTHFLNELVEMDMLYLALFPDRGQNRLDESVFLDNPNRLIEIVPDAGRWENAIRVIDAVDAVQPGEKAMLVADAVEQRVICYRAPAG